MLLLGQCKAEVPVPIQSAVQLSLATWKTKEPIAGLWLIDTRLVVSAIRLRLGPEAAMPTLDGMLRLVAFCTALANGLLCLWVAQLVCRSCVRQEPQMCISSAWPQRPYWLQALAASKQMSEDVVA